MKNLLGVLFFSFCLSPVFGQADETVINSERALIYCSDDNTELWNNALELQEDGNACICAGEAFLTIETDVDLAITTRETLTAYLAQRFEQKVISLELKSSKIDGGYYFTFSTADGTERTAAISGVTLN
jgi:hypothetical protein